MKIQPGMLCLVIGGRNAGRECTVIRRLKVGDYVPEVLSRVLADAWFVQGPSIEAMDKVGAHYIKGYGAETSLMPLANGGDDAIVKSEVTDYVARQTNKNTLLPERA